MKRSVKRLFAGGATAALAWHVMVGWNFAQADVPPVPRRALTASSADVPLNPLRDAYFGDLHQHTTFSYDAYLAVGTRNTPDDAYRFASGETVNYLGQPVRRDVPLDFLAVTDHAENMGVFNQLDDPRSVLSQSELGKAALAAGAGGFLKLLRQLGPGANLGSNAKQVEAETWRRTIDAANANYRPGRFTTFIGYEWTSMPDNQNLHRNVIFRGDSAPPPFSRFDSENPEDLWAWLARAKAAGQEALAIPHNANVSNGLMYDWNRFDGRPIDAAYARTRAANEPLAEISQTKGTSETHPLLSNNDEFAGFEIWDKLLLGDKESSKPGSYWRDGLGRGLAIEKRVGVNPFKYGAAGGSDLHTGVNVSREQDYAQSINIGGAHRTKEQIAAILKDGPQSGARSQIIGSSSALTGVWAEANTREAIFAAFRRKETFATSGTRLKVRFFGGWNFPANLLAKRDWVKSAYADGVPMGADLPANRRLGSPSFVIQAVKDANSGNLDRVQVVKVWIENGQSRERVFDVAWSGRRRIDPRSGKLPAVGSTVDLKTGRYANTIGAAQLATVWRDPAFVADQPAVYYVRVLEIPTPRWSTLRAAEYGLPLSKNAPATLQERAWSSPIWYEPRARPAK